MGVAPLKTESGTVTSSQEKAKVLNDTFTSIFTLEDTSTKPVVNGTAAPLMPDTWKSPKITE